MHFCLGPQQAYSGMKNAKNFYHVAAFVNLSKSNCTDGKIEDFTNGVIGFIPSQKSVIAF